MRKQAKDADVDLLIVDTGISDSVDFHECSTNYAQATCTMALV